MKYKLVLLRVRMSKVTTLSVTTALTAGGRGTARVELGHRRMLGRADIRAGKIYGRRKVGKDIEAAGRVC